MKKFVEDLEKYALILELIIIFVTIILAILLQILINKYDLSQYLKSEFLLTFYQEIVCGKSLDYMKIVDGFAVAVGGISFFVQKWVDKDTQNIVYAMLLILLLFVSHILKLIGLDVSSFVITVASIILIIIPFIAIIYDSFVNSNSINEILNTPHISQK